LNRPHFVSAGLWGLGIETADRAMGLPGPIYHLRHTWRIRLL